MFVKFLRFISPVALLLLGACASNPNPYPAGGYTPYAQNYAPSGYQANYGAPQPYANVPPQQAPQAQQPYTPQAQGDFRPVPAGQKIKLKAQDIKFISSYNPPNRLPNVDHMLLVYPEQIMHKWAVNRFTVDRTPDRHVRFLIKDASIIEENVVTGGSLNKSVKQQYTGKLDVTIQIVDSEGRVLIETSSSVMRREIVEKDVSLEEREKVWINMTFDLIKQLSNRLDHDLSSPSFNEFIER